MNREDWRSSKEETKRPDSSRPQSWWTPRSGTTCRRRAKLPTWRRPRQSFFDWSLIGISNSWGWGWPDEEGTRSRRADCAIRSHHVSREICDRRRNGCICELTSRVGVRVVGAALSKRPLRLVAHRRLETTPQADKPPLLQPSTVGDNFEIHPWRLLQRWPDRPNFAARSAASAACLRRNTQNRLSDHPGTDLQSRSPTGC